jgi:hypothetical protein
MRRKTFDALASGVGLIIVAVLVIAGALLAWGSSFANSEVHNQLAAQKIYFPPKAAFAHPKAGTEITRSMIPTVSQYAGQQLLTGAQAQVYANDFISVHLSEMPHHGIYATISGLAMQAKPGTPQATQLAGLEQTSFQGTTLRGLLLEAYGFGKLGQIAGIASIVAFCAAGAMLLLSGLGFWHGRRVSAAAEVFPKLGAHTEAPVEA